MFSRPVSFIVPAIFALLLFGGVYGIERTFQSNRSSSKSSLEQPVLGTVSDFSLTNSFGKNVSWKSVGGKVAILNFFFSRCPHVCPEMNRELERVLGSFEHEKDLRILSVSVDPEHDSPEVLKDYARQYRKGDLRWSFLTGEADTITTLMKGQFFLGTTNLPDAHSTSAILIDRSSRIRGFYRLRDEGETERLIESLRSLF